MLSPRNKKTVSLESATRAGAAGPEASKALRIRSAHSHGQRGQRSRPAARGALSECREVRGQRRLAARAGWLGTRPGGSKRRATVAAQSPPPFRPQRDACHRIMAGPPVALLPLPRLFYCNRYGAAHETSELARCRARPRCFSACCGRSGRGYSVARRVLSVFPRRGAVCVCDAI